MNEDQVKGKAKEIGGKIQEGAGKVVGSSEQQAKGLNKQAEGKLQKNGIRATADIHPVMVAPDRAPGSPKPCDQPSQWPFRSPPPNSSTLWRKAPFC